MAVDEQVNAVHVLAHVDGAVADALVGNTQVAQADNQVRAGSLQFVHLSLSAGVQLLPLGEDDVGHLGGVSLGAGLGGGQTKHAHLHAVQIVDLVGGEHGAVGGLIGHVGAEDVKLGVLGQGLQVVDAEVQLVVAHGHGIVPGGVHELNGALALVGADQRLAHDGVAGGEQEDLGAGGLKVLFQLGHTGHADGLAFHGHVGAVGVVGVENDNLSVYIGNLIGRDSVLLSHGRYEQRAYHCQRQEKGQELTRTLHTGHSTFHSFSEKGPDALSRLSLPGAPAFGKPPCFAASRAFRSQARSWASLPFPFLKTL